MANEGIPVVLSIVLLFAILCLGAIVTHGISLMILAVASFLLILFSIYFFRDPDRTIPTGANLIVSPADGRIVLIQKVEENEFIKASAQKISIFMSAFNVHVNRIPIDGRVIYFNYQQGKFHPAYKEAASYNNEQTTIVIENDLIKLMLKQIAGILARRIICRVCEGREVKKGQRFGMIKFGSRIDLLLPITVILNIKLNEKVRAGVTIIGTY